MRLVIDGHVPSTETTVPLNPEINLEKYEHLCQVKELGGKVPP